MRTKVIIEIAESMRPVIGCSLSYKDRQGRRKKEDKFPTMCVGGLGNVLYHEPVYDQSGQVHILTSIYDCLIQCSILYCDWLHRVIRILCPVVSLEMFLAVPGVQQPIPTLSAIAHPIPILIPIPIPITVIINHLSKDQNPQHPSPSPFSRRHSARTTMSNASRSFRSTLTFRNKRC